ncbi:hypothetical protein HanXRQr2_Chr12g0564071 [Helianthus annuus]|uniref:Transmembrane protein n=1 Tax=Helianthus annuus TaxID=4232 RepID=A0A9K3MYG5_HELAN|nr:hypothetical protein HanXRQr2_Chr12g0564071 [Helianthus annuus]
MERRWSMGCWLWSSPVVKSIEVGGGVVDEVASELLDGEKVVDGLLVVVFEVGGGVVLFTWWIMLSLRQPMK